VRHGSKCGDACSCLCWDLLLACLLLWVAWLLACVLLAPFGPLSFWFVMLRLWFLEWFTVGMLVSAVEVGNDCGPLYRLALDLCSSNNDQ
jgi:hypothetical protein